MTRKPCGWRGALNSLLAALRYDRFERPSFMKHWRKPYQVTAAFVVPRLNRVKERLLRHGFFANVS